MGAAGSANMTSPSFNVGLLQQFFSSSDPSNKELKTRIAQLSENEVEMSGLKKRK